MMELTSRKSYTGKEIKNWAETNADKNDIAFRIFKKYFNNTDKLPVKTSFYFVKVTESGGVLLTRDNNRSPKSQKLVRVS